MKFPRVAFVAAPAATPTVLLELNDEAPLYLLGGETGDFTLGSPSFDADPFAVGRDYGVREPVGSVRVKGTPAVVAAAMSALARRLLAPRSWLMFQRDAASQPVFARVYASGPGALEWRNAGAGVYDVPLSLVADPFLYGARETLAPQTLGNDPSASGGQFWRLPAVKGDAPAPLRLLVTTTGSPERNRLFVSTQAFPTAVPDYVAPYRVVTSDLDVAQDTSNTTGLANFIGGNGRTTSFAVVPDMARRVRFTSGTVRSGGATVVLPPGVYRLLARMDATAGGIRLQAEQAVNVSDVRSNDPVDLPSSFATYVDLGLIYHPVGGVPDETETAALADYGPPVLGFDLSAQRTAGTASLVWDDVLLVPVHLPSAPDGTRFATIDCGFENSATSTGVLIDGEASPRTARLVKAGPPAALVNALPTRLVGGWPRVVPGMTNVLHVIGDALNDTLASPVQVAASYLPRYLHLRPDGG